MPRAACSSSMSAARSMTACSAASFCSDPSSAADLGQRRPALAAADVFLHQLDLRRRHEDLRAAVEFELQVLFGLAVLLQQLAGRDSGRCRATDGRRSRLRAARESCRSPGPAAGARARCRSVRWNSSLPLTSTMRSAHQPETRLRSRPERKVQPARLRPAACRRRLVQPLRLRPRSGRR